MKTEVLKTNLEQAENPVQNVCKYVWSYLQYFSSSILQLGWKCFSEFYFSSQSSFSKVLLVLCAIKGRQAFPITSLQRFLFEIWEVYLFHESQTKTKTAFAWVSLICFHGIQILSYLSVQKKSGSYSVIGRIYTTSNTQICLEIQGGEISHRLILWENIDGYAFNNRFFRSVTFVLVINL